MLILRIVFITAFCVATVGAAGFAQEVERLAWPLFGGGLAVTVAAGLALRSRTRAAIHEAGAAGLDQEGLLAAVEQIEREVVRLEQDMADLDARAFAERVDDVLKDRCHPLGLLNEDYLRVLGAAAYTRVWDGFANGERLLARAWSMAADGFLDEARAEVPKALAHFRRAVEHRAT